MKGRKKKQSASFFHVTRLQEILWRKIRDDFHGLIKSDPMFCFPAISVRKII